MSPSLHNRRQENRIPDFVKRVLNTRYRIGKGGFIIVWLVCLRSVKEEFKEEVREKA